jgi:hypothetical protein
MKWEAAPNDFPRASCTIRIAKNGWLGGGNTRNGDEHSDRALRVRADEERELRWRENGGCD